MKAFLAIAAVAVLLMYLSSSGGPRTFDDDADAEGGGIPAYATYMTSENDANPTPNPEKTPAPWPLPKYDKKTYDDAVAAGKGMVVAAGDMTQEEWEHAKLEAEHDGRVLCTVEAGKHGFTPGVHKLKVDRHQRKQVFDAGP